MGVAFGHKCLERKIEIHKRPPSRLPIGEVRRQFWPLCLEDRMFRAIAMAAARVALILLTTNAQPQIDISQILRAGGTGDAIRHR